MKEFLKKFSDHFNMAPAAAAQAPGRLEILGNHTDYNEGFVLSCAVGQTTKFALAPVSGTLCKVKDFRDGSEMSFDLAALDKVPPRNGTKYIIGMMRELRERGCRFSAFNAGLESCVPLSAGMSSSAALETACGLTFGKAFDFTIGKAELARAGQGVENNFLGLKSGLLDQFSSLFGKADSIIMSDFRSVEVIDTLPLPPGYVFVVINSMKKHHLVDSDYNVRRNDCESAAAKLAALYPGVKTLRDVSPQELEAAADKLDLREFRRASHVVGECARVKAAVELLRRGDIKSFGRLLWDSHESSRLNFENSTDELDYLVELSHSIPGCIGARLSGGGFGGITIHLAAADGASEYAARVCQAYQIRTGIEAESFICSVGDGAAVYDI